LSQASQYSQKLKKKWEKMDQPEIKPMDTTEEQTFDIDLINGIRSEKNFCFGVEKRLITFLEDPAM
jgi:hypothetical protein